MKGSGGVSLGDLMREIKVHRTPVYQAVAVKTMCSGKQRVCTGTPRKCC